MKEGLELQELSVSYGHARALHRASLAAPAGMVTALVGPNGAGKSSLILASYGAVRSTGRVLFKGTDLSRLPPMARARLGLTLVPQGRQIFPTLTVRENLVIMCRLLGLSLDHVEAAYERFPILKVRARQLAGVLSGGEQQMLAVTRALMGPLAAVLLDEITTGLAPLIVDQLMDTARELAAAGVAVLMAEPSIGVIRDRIDRGYVLLRGEVAAEAAGGDELEHAYQRVMGMSLAGT